MICFNPYRNQLRNRFLGAMQNHIMNWRRKIIWRLINWRSILLEMNSRLPLDMILNSRIMLLGYSDLFEKHSKLIPGKFLYYCSFNLITLNDTTYRSEYLLSLTGKYVLSELGSPGKSGSFFYFSQDYRFIIKTIHHTEHKFIRQVLKNYFEVKKIIHLQNIWYYFIDSYNNPVLLILVH
jgi:hypothetical protein